MRNVSLGFLEEVVKPSRTVDAKIVINGYAITSNDIISYEIAPSLTDNDMPTIGSAVASSVKFEVTKSSLPMIYVGQKLEFYAGLLINGVMEWVRVGTFKTTAEYVTKKKLTVEIEAFDEDTVNELRARAKDVLLTMEIAKEEDVEALSESLKGMDGLTPELIAKLAEAGSQTRDDRADPAVDELTDRTGVSEEQARALIPKAREHWYA